MITADQIREYLTHCLEGTNVPGFGSFYKGKVRDCYETKDGKKRVMVTTDRQSAFDKNLGLIPLKGQALNQLSYWWFEKTKDLVPNHVLEITDPNILVCKQATPFKIEMVIRGYLSGSTDTSAWKAYEKGERMYCGHQLPEGMKKNQAFPKPLITPTTKSDEHDEKISATEIVERGLATKDQWAKLEQYTFALFARGQELAEKAGLILVDTKYEFAVDPDGQIILIDEIHTSDSSRFWKADSYEERISRGEEPENFDKEFLRLWYTSRCNPYKDSLPEMPDDFRIEVAKRYITTYEMLTGKSFELPGKDVKGRVEGVLRKMVP